MKTNPAAFVEDVSIRGMIHALTIRSPVARGTLKAIECPKLPHSYHLITAEYIPGKNELADFSVPVLADKNLSYIGQPVAILAGPEVSKLEDLASRIELTVEKEAPVLSSAVFGPEDVIVRRTLISGEPESGYEKCGKIVMGTYTTGIQAHWYSEPHGAVAVPSSLHQKANTKTKKEKKPSPDPADQLPEQDKEIEKDLTVYTATQWPYHVKRSVEQVLGWKSGSVKIYPTLTAVHLDGKIWYPSLVACHAALAAWITKSPVKLMLIGEEDFTYSPKRNRANIEMCSGLGEKGEILASTLRLTLDLGAQGIFENEIIENSCLGSLGLYHHPAFRLSGVGLRTNIPPQGPMAGFGLSQGFFAAERHASHIADTLGQDPAEWRKNNFLKKNQSLAIGTVLKNSMPLPELIDAVAAMSDYYRKWASYELLKNSRRKKNWDFVGGPLRGIGISTACQGNGFLFNDKTGNGNCTVEITLEKDNSLEIKTSIIPSKSGHMDSWRSLAQEILGVEGSSVRLTNNTQDAPDSGPGTLSRNISVVTKLVERCCTAIRKQRTRNPLPITVKRSVKPAAGFENTESEAFAHPSWGAAVVEIEMDPVSLSPTIRGIWLVADSGKILSQRWARSTLRTGIIQALGWACRELVFYEEGAIPSHLYHGYDIPTPVEIPPIHVDFIWNDTADPTGIGDLPFCCVPAAYVQAVSQVMDYHFEKIPLEAREIWDVVKQKQQERSA